MQIMLLFNTFRTVIHFPTTRLVACRRSSSTVLAHAQMGRSGIVGAHAGRVRIVA